VFGGELVTIEGLNDAHYVRPALVEMPGHNGPVIRETFLRRSSTS
jgi:aldehyde dehydrogenase (NAD+)